MAEGDGVLYKNWKLGVMQAEMDMSSSMAVLLLTGYAPSQSDDFYDDVSASEVSSGSGYTTLGDVLASDAVTLAGSNAEFDAVDNTWSSLSASGGQPNYAIVYQKNASASAARLVGYWAISTSTNGGNFTLQWHASGIVTLT